MFFHPMDRRQHPQTARVCFAPIASGGVAAQQPPQAHTRSSWNVQRVLRAGALPTRLQYASSPGGRSRAGLVSSMDCRLRATLATVSAGLHAPLSYKISRQMCPAHARRRSERCAPHRAACWRPAQRKRTVAVDVRVQRRGAQEAKLRRLHGVIWQE